MKELKYTISWLQYKSNMYYPECGTDDKLWCVFHGGRPITSDDPIEKSCGANELKE